VAYAVEHIISALKAARQEKGLSQRELSQKAGVPQSHISKIENGAVDLQLSSLIELARVLDLEIMSIPRRLVPAVQVVVSSEPTISQQGLTTVRAINELQRIQNTAKHLHLDNQNIEQWRRLQQTLSDLKRLRLGGKELEQIRALSENLKKIQEGPNALTELQRTLKKLQSMRNMIAHRAGESTVLPAVRPAYTLDDDDDG
jgi:transcriptional regulator with XRE-family HTH domain